jgi:precorrin-6B methylase 2
LGWVGALVEMGAELALKTTGEHGDARVESALAAVSAAAGLDLDSLAPPEQAMVLGLIRLYFAQAGDLLNAPAREPGWTFTDPLVLEGMGRASMVMPHLMVAIPELASVSSLLDVGAGVGLLAVSAANVWPAATVVGIDTWEPSIERARANVKGAGLGDRITIRNQSVQALDDVDAYDCAWLPTFFLAEEVLPAAVAAIARALQPGGWIVLGLFRQPPDPVAQTTMALRTIRSGGTNLDPKGATDLLAGAGYASIRTIEPQGPAPAVFVIGQRSDG